MSFRWGRGGSFDPPPWILKFRKICLFFPMLGQFYAFYFLLYSIEESIGFVKIFDFRFLMDLHVLGCPEHEFTIFRKCLCGCVCVWMCVWMCVDVCVCVDVCNTNFVGAVTHELMVGIERNFGFRWPFI